MSAYSGSVLAGRMVQCLSQSTTEEPLLHNASDAIALLTHACMLTAGFRLVEINGTRILEATKDSSLLPPGWNSRSLNTNEADYAFCYAHDKSSLQYIIKHSPLGSKVVINGLAVGDDKVHTMDLSVQDYISQSSLPFNPATKDKETLSESLQQVFIFPARIQDAASLFNTRILQALAPGLQKSEQDNQSDPSQITRNTQTQAHTTPEDPSPRAQSHPSRGELNPLPRRPHPPLPSGEFAPPGFDDEYDLLRRPGSYPTRPGPNLGDRDLYPAGLGPRDPFSGMPGLSGPGGGMHPTFDDPMFGGRAGNGLGAQGFDPRRPPGARYDPIGPGDGPPQAGGFRGRMSGGPGSGPPNPFGGFGPGDFI